MKKNILIIILLITTTLFSQRNGLAEYEFSYKKFDDEPKNISVANARKNADISAEYATNHNYILKFSFNESLYYIESSMAIDGVDNEFAYKFSKYFFSNGIIYQNNETQESINQLTSMNELYLSIDSIPNDWKISSETKYIGKFKCFKAVSSCNTCNNNQIVTAWFSPEIPAPFGPAGFGGTPGLILEISKYRYTLRLKKIKLSDKTIIIEKPTKGIITTKEKLKGLKMKKRAEIMNKNR